MKRRGFSLVELAVFAALALALAGIVMGLWISTQRHDASTAVRLDGVASLATTLAHLWVDTWRSRTVGGAPGVAMIRFAFHAEPGATPEEVEYRWPGAGRALERGGHRLGVAPGAELAFSHGAHTRPVLSLAVSAGAPGAAGRRIALELPVSAPDAEHRRRFAYWGPPPATPGDVEDPPPED